MKFHTQMSIQSKKEKEKEDDRAEIRMLLPRKSKLYKKICKNADKQQRSPAGEVLVFLEANY